MTLTDREKDILTQILQTWDEADNPISGGVPYSEVLALIEKLGLEEPRGLVAFLKRVEGGREIAR